ncbi:hypothetical protein ACFYO0_42500 [Streptomyces sp. NPDC006365]|uniref:P-type ATPase n=1 Tax=Streptomyces sp. NPDC006365 TaxID=3364744 RepID=UPI00367376CA
MAQCWSISVGRRREPWKRGGPARPTAPDTARPRCAAVVSPGTGGGGGRPRPRDVVLLEADDRVPADGRLTVAESVEVAEAALTGESQPVAKRPVRCREHPARPHPSCPALSVAVTGRRITA